MIVLTETTDNLQVVLGEAISSSQCQCHSSWAHMNANTHARGRTLINTNGVTDVTVMSAPTSGYSRALLALTVYNNDTITHSVVVKIDANGTEYVVFRATLVSGATLVYDDKAGWFTNGDNQSIGYAINVQALTSSPTDSQTVYFGMLPKAPVTTGGTSKVYIPRAGAIKRAEIYCYSGTAGSNESWSLYVRLNNLTDTLIATVAVSASERVFSNSALNIAVSVGDYIEIKGVQPLWGTNPLTTIYGGYVYIE